MLVMRLISASLAALVGGFAGLVTGGLLVNVIGTGPVAVGVGLTLTAAGAVMGACFTWRMAPRTRPATRQPSRLTLTRSARFFAGLGGVLILIPAVSAVGSAVFLLVTEPGFLVFAAFLAVPAIAAAALAFQAGPGAIRGQAVGGQLLGAGLIFTLPLLYTTVIATGGARVIYGTELACSVLAPVSYGMGRRRFSRGVLIGLLAAVIGAELVIELSCLAGWAQPGRA